MDFSNCPNLTKINGFAFFYCSKISSLSFKNCKNLTIIGGAAFGNINVSFIDLHECVNLISLYGAFSVNGKIKAINFGKIAISFIGYEAFRDMNGMTTFDFRECENLSSVGSQAFSRCINLTEVYFPSSVTQIGSSCFEFCSKLIKVDIPYDSKLHTIEDYAFRNVPLNYFFIFKNLTFNGMAYLSYYKYSKKYNI